MARNNGTFRYTALPLEATRDEATGFYTDDDAPVWVKGCECQVEKFIPAKHWERTGKCIHTPLMCFYHPTLRVI